MVVEAKVAESFSKLLQLVGCLLQRILSTVNPGAALHGLVHFRTDGGDALAAPSLAQKLLFQTAFLIIRLRDDVFAGRLLLK